jgi:hypothetical protein
LSKLFSLKLKERRKIDSGMLASITGTVETIKDSARLLSFIALMTISTLQSTSENIDSLVDYEKIRKNMEKADKIIQFKKKAPIIIR